MAIRGVSTSSSIGNFNVLRQLWDECLGNKLDVDVKGSLIGANSQISKYDLLYGLHLCERILKITDNLSKTIQNESMSASEARSTAQQTVLMVKGMRNDTMFDLFYQLIDYVRQHTVNEEPSLPRRGLLSSNSIKVLSQALLWSLGLCSFIPTRVFLINQAMQCIKTLKNCYWRQWVERIVQHICQRSLSLTGMTWVKVSVQQLQIFSSSLTEMTWVKVSIQQLQIFSSSLTEMTWVKGSIQQLQMIHSSSPKDH